METAATVHVVRDRDDGRYLHNVYLSRRSSEYGFHDRAFAKRAGSPSWSRVEPERAAEALDHVDREKREMRASLQQGETTNGAGRIVQLESSDLSTAPSGRKETAK